MFVKSGGKLITRDELMNELWADTFVEDNNLSQHIRALRKALGEPSENGAVFIETVPRRGYRFVADVREISKPVTLPEDKYHQSPIFPQTSNGHKQGSNGDKKIEPLTFLRENSGDNFQKNPSKIQSADSTLPLRFVTAPKKLSPFVKITAFVILLAVFGGIGYRLYYSDKSRDEQIVQTEQTPAPNLKIQRMTGDGKSVEAAISPDGKLLSYVKREEGRLSLWIKQISTNSNLEIVEAGVFEDFFHVTFTPDGSFVYFNGAEKDKNTGSIFRVPTLGGSISKVVSEAVGISFSPDGKSFVSGRFKADPMETEILIIDADGANERELASLAGPRWFDFYNAWSPDGKLIVCGVQDDSLSKPDFSFVTIDVADGTVKELTNPQWDGSAGIAWYPDMSGLIFAGFDGGNFATAQIWEISFPSGEARRLTHDLNNYRGISLTTDGQTLATTERNHSTNIWISPDEDWRRARQITTGKSKHSGIAWTPDKRIVFISTESGFYELWIMNADGSGAKQLTNDRRVKMAPVVSPDGRYIVYASMEDNGHIWRIETDGGVPVELAKGGPHKDVSPDGKWIIYTGFPSDKSFFMALWQVSSEGGEARQLTDFNAFNPKISPDGKYIACYLEDEQTQVIRIGIIPFEGGAPVKTFDVPQTIPRQFPLVWTPDGMGVTYFDRGTGDQNLWLQPIKGSAPKQLTRYKGSGVFYQAWTRDAKQIALIRGEQTNDALMITDFR